MICNMQYYCSTQIWWAWKRWKIARLGIINESCKEESKHRTSTRCVAKVQEHSRDGKKLQGGPKIVIIYGRQWVLDWEKRVDGLVLNIVKTWGNFQMVSQVEIELHGEKEGRKYFLVRDRNYHNLNWSWWKRKIRIYSMSSFYYDPTDFVRNPLEIYLKKKTLRSKYTCLKSISYFREEG